MKLLAIDGNSLLNRAFYGIKLLTTKDGRYTNAVYGFINILNRLLESEQPDGVAVAFDLKAPTFRHERYSEYKAGRKGMPQELAEQLPVIKEWLTLAGYHCLSQEGFEADDILGTLAERCEQEAHTCVIATGDRDSLQLVSERTKVLLTATKMGRPEILEYTPAALFERYGLTPSGMIELKALMGDSSDHIPGVAGVGEKTATDLISRFHTIDEIYENLETLDIKESVRNKLRDGKESAYLSHWLGTICKSVPLDCEFEGLKTRARDEAALARLMTDLEFFKLMEKMGIRPAEQTVTVETAKQNETLTVGDGQNLVGTVDLYQNGLEFAAVCKNEVFALTEERFAEILCDETLKKRVHDSKALYKKYPTACGLVFDSLLAAYLCNPSASSYAPDRLLQEYGEAFAFEGEETELLRNAAAFHTVYNQLDRALEESGQKKLLEEIELPLARVLAEMETYGFLVDPEGLQKMGVELSAKIADIEEQIYEQVGYRFNLNSPKQLGIALFEDLGITPAKKTKSGYSTNAEILEKLQYEYPVVGLVLQYRQFAKLKSTYCDGLLNAVGEDGRIRSTFNQTEARTGRISSLEPNLQNIPVRTEEGRRLREYFIAPEGRVLIDADYSQIELRVLAAMAEDKAMINAFQSGTDIHTVTAAQVFNIPEGMVTPLLRRQAKAVNFGIIYGIGAFSLSKDIGVTRNEADQYIKSYLAGYPAVATYLENCIEEARQLGFVATLFGRRRYLPELSSSNHMLRAFGERVARNAPIQGTAADIIKIAMVKVRDRLKKELPDAKLILQVHDELIVECAEQDAERCRILLQEEMGRAANLSVPLLTDAHCGKNWLAAKG